MKMIADVENLDYLECRAIECLRLAEVQRRLHNIKDYDAQTIMAIRLLLLAIIHAEEQYAQPVEAKVNKQRT